jgi:forkhead box protein K
MERCAGERGKGFFWGIEEKFIPGFQEQEARLEHIQQQQANGSMSIQNGIKVTAGKNKKGGAALTDPPLRRSVKAGSGPLPPPLTNTPLAMKSALIPSPGSFASPYPQLHIPQHPQSNAGTSNTSSFTTTMTASSSSATPAQPESSLPTVSEAATAAATQSTSFISSLPPSVCIPIVIGPVPPNSTSSSSPPSVSSPSTSHLPTPPIVLHENTLILNPSVFSHLTPEQLKELEALGAQKALEILQSYIVRFLKERIRGEKDGSRGGRGRGRGRPKRGVGAGGLGRGGAPAPGAGSGPFTTTPLPPPNGVAPLPPPVTHETASGSGMQGKEIPPKNGVIPPAINSQGPLPAPETAIPPASIPIPLSTSQTDPGPGHTSESPIIIVDDVDADEPKGPAMKKRRLDGQGGAIAV